MREFFKGWRRKIGLLALFTACLFMVMWVRSLFVLDRFYFPQPDRVILSLDGACRWLSFTPIDSDVTGWPKQLRWVPSPLADKHRHSYDIYNLNAMKIHWRWRWGGFDFSAVSESFETAPIPPSTPPRRYEIRQIPYWSLIVPFTCVSAYLILWKPRKRAKESPPQS